MGICLQRGFDKIVGPACFTVAGSTGAGRIVLLLTGTNQSWKMKVFEKEKSRMFPKLRIAQ